MAFTLPPLPYNIADLYSYLNQSTVDTQYNEVTVGFFNTINRLIGNSPAADCASLQQALARVGENTKNAELYRVLIHAINYLFFWEGLAPNTKSAPSTELMKEIEITFGSFENFKTKFAENITRSPNSPNAFTWLIMSNGQLYLKTSIFVSVTPKTTNTNIPLLAIAGWMGGFDALWNLINWEQVNDRFARAG